MTVGNPLGVAAGVALFEGLYSAAEGKPASVVVRDAVVSGALAYVGGRLVEPAVEAAAARLLTRKGFTSLDEALRTVTRQRFESLPEELYYYTDKETARLIAESGRIGKDLSSTVYLTPEGGLSPLQAQLTLALPQRNTAEVVIRVPRSLLNPDRVLLIRRVTGNVFNRPGGGVEVLYRGPIYLREP